MKCIRNAWKTAKKQLGRRRPTASERVNEGFFFLWLELILQVNTWPNFDRKLYCFEYNSTKNSNFNFFLNPSFNHAYQQKIFDFFSDKVITSYPGHCNDIFFKGSSITSSQRLNFQYFLMKILWNFVEMLFFHMPKVRLKEFI